MQWPADFISHINQNFSDAKEFIDAIENPPVAAVRLNPYKKNHYPDFVASAKQVSWCKYGYILNKRPVFTADPLFASGTYYVQEISSMFLHHVVEFLSNNYSIKNVFDACAAPGGKTTILQSALSQDTLIIANEVIKSRVPVLVQNMQKWGLANTIITNNKIEDFKPLKNFFDLVLVDAPCSGEGLFRKQPEAAKNWSLENVKLCALRQQKILHYAIDVLKPGGLLLYSTCTFNTTENESIVNLLIDNYGFKKIIIPIESNWNITQLEQACYRFLPHLTDGEGLFLCVLQKPDDGIKPPKIKNKFFGEPQKNIPDFYNWLENIEDFFITSIQNEYYAIPNRFKDEFYFFKQVLNVVYYGVCLGQLNKKQKLIPHHALALYIGLLQSVPKTDITIEQALLYLKKQHLNISENMPIGYHLLTYKNVPLGFVNNIGSRINNCYPSNWRIIKDWSVNEMA